MQRVKLRIGVNFTVIFEGVLVIGGRDYMGPPNEGKDYTWYKRYISANRVIIYYQAPFTFEAEKSIDQCEGDYPAIFMGT